MEPVTEVIARFVGETNMDDLPSDAVETAKLHILDTIGALCAGSREEVAGIVRAYIQSTGCSGESTLLTQRVRTSAQYAAFGNGIAAHALDFDDYEWPSMVHPSAVVLPAVLALGEKGGAGGEACLEAYLVGLEVIAKVGSGVNPSHYDKGWHATGTLGVLGAAAACAKLLKHDLRTTKRTIGIAASMASGLRGNFGTMTKPLHAGHASRGGVESALLASAGFTADETILERELGFCSIFTEGGVFDAKKIVEHLGRPFSIVSPGIAIKPYPSCAATHSVLDGVFQLVENNGISASDVEKVECGIFYLYPKMLIHASPGTGLEGKFSLEFCVALALTDREVTLQKFTDEKVRRPDIQRLIKRVRKSVSDEVGGRGTQYPGAIVKITLKDGRSFSTKVGARKGSPANPLSQAEVVAKFKANSALALSSDKIGTVLDKVLQMEKMINIADLVGCLEASRKEAGHEIT